MTMRNLLATTEFVVISGGCTRTPFTIYVSGLLFSSWTPNVFSLVSPWVPSGRFKYGSTSSSSDHVLLCLYLS